MGTVNHGHSDLLRYIANLEKRVEAAEKRQSLVNSSLSNGQLRVYGPDDPTKVRVELSSTKGLTVKDKNGAVTMIEQSTTDGALLYPFQPAGQWAVTNLAEWNICHPDQIDTTTFENIGSVKFHRFSPYFSTVVQFYNNTGNAYYIRLNCDHNSNTSSVLSIPSNGQVGLPGDFTTYTLFSLNIETNAPLYSPIRVNLQAARQTGSGPPVSPYVLKWAPSGCYQGALPTTF